MGVVVCEAYRDEGVAPTRGMSAFCGRPAPGAMGVVVCEAYRDEGVAPAQNIMGRINFWRWRAFQWWA